MVDTSVIVTREGANNFIKKVRNSQTWYEKSQVMVQLKDMIFIYTDVTK